MPATDPPTIYLTFDDGPNPAATPQLLDVLERHDVSATFFVINRYITDDTLPLVQRMFDDGHAVALHTHTRQFMIAHPGVVAATLQEVAARIELITGHRPCRAFRPKGGNRSLTMLMGAARAGYTVVGFGWMLWDLTLFRDRTADALVPRFVAQASPGDIVVIHDGDDDTPNADRLYAVETVDRLIPALRARGFQFGTICP
jgi:chitooligosaccharide deacetylase